MSTITVYETSRFAPSFSRGVTSAPRRTTEPAAVRLTRRGRLVLLLAVIAALAITVVALGSSTVATSEVGAVPATTVVTVQEGQTLWQIAAENHPGAWRGHLLFLSAGMAWGLYTVVFRQSGLTPLQGLCIGIFWSIVVIGPVLLWIGLPFADAGWAEISVMAVLQGLLMTVLALLLYGIAVTRLGAAETGAFGALTPILAMLGGALFLQEEIGPLKIAGVAVVAVGVILASGILTRQRTRPDPAPVD